MKQHPDLRSEPDLRLFRWRSDEVKRLEKWKLFDAPAFLLLFLFMGINALCLVDGAMCCNPHLYLTVSDCVSISVCCLHGESLSHCFSFLWRLNKSSLKFSVYFYSEFVSTAWQFTKDSSHESLYTFHTLSTCEVGLPGRAADCFIRPVTHRSEILTRRPSSYDSATW